MADASLKATSGNKTFALGLVGIRVSMMPAFDDRDTRRVERSMLCPQHKCRVKQQWRCADENHIVEQPMYGVEYPPKSGNWLLIEESEWASLGALTDTSMEFQAWVPTLDPMLVESPYLIWPTNMNLKEDRERFGILYDLLKSQGGWLLVITSGDHGTQRMFAVGYHDTHDILVALKCRHMAYLRTAQIGRVRELMSELPVPDTTHMNMAKVIFSSLATDYDALNVTDTLAEAQWALVHAKAAGKEIDLTESNRLVSAATLEDQLRATIEANKKGTKKKAAKAGVSRPTSAPKTKGVKA